MIRRSYWNERQCLHFLGVFLIVWLLLVLITLMVLRKRDYTVYELSQNLIKTQQELEIVHAENIRLGSLRNLNYKKSSCTQNFQNTKPAVPSREHEFLRRRIFSNIKEIWYYVDSELQSLLSAEEKKAKRLNKIKGMVGEHYRSLMKDFSDLAEVDGYSTWRKRESRALSTMVQNRLNNLQNPSDCDTARKLVCDINKNCGYGCQLHHIVYCFIIAYGTQRTLILESEDWHYSKGRWEDVFLPLSNTCLLPNGLTVRRWPGKRDTQVMVLPTLDRIKQKPHFLPQMIPDDLAPRLTVLHGDPVVWWIGQFVKYALRPQPWTGHRFDEYAKKFKFRKPIVGVHIRRTDKIGTEASFHSLEEYMVHVEQYYKLKELSEKVDKKRIYLATDEWTLFSEIRRKYPEYEIAGDESISKTASLDKRYSDRSLNGIITDIHFLSLCDHLVCTFSSQVCRAVYEIMNTMYPDASMRYASLDDIFYFGGQEARLQEAVLSHRADGPDEIDLEVGDVLVVAGNHWNGYSNGTNLRTRKEGLYPSFKVIPKIETTNFHNRTLYN